MEFGFFDVMKKVAQTASQATNKALQETAHVAADAYDETNRAVNQAATQVAHEVRVTADTTWTQVEAAQKVAQPLLDDPTPLVRKIGETAQQDLARDAVTLHNAAVDNRATDAVQNATGATVNKAMDVLEETLGIDGQALKDEVERSRLKPIQQL